MRYERKYRISACDHRFVEQVLRNHPASFRKIFPDRQINNIYWDTIGLQTYHDNVVGIANRQKFRLRWYGNDVGEVIAPKLEIKIRQNELGDKKIFDIPSFDLHQPEVHSDEIEQLTRSNTNLVPVLLNSYHRSYWGTFDGEFRMTIDYNMRFHSLLNEGAFRGYRHRDEAVILELKYDEKMESQSDRITQYIPFRRTKNSKYVIGVERTNGWLVE